MGTTLGTWEPLQRSIVLLKTSQRPNVTRHRVSSVVSQSVSNGCSESQERLVFFVQFVAGRILACTKASMVNGSTSNPRHQTKKPHHVLQQSSGRNELRRFHKWPLASSHSCVVHVNEKVGAGDREYLVPLSSTYVMTQIANSFSLSQPTCFSRPSATALKDQDAYGKLTL